MDWEAQEITQAYGVSRHGQDQADSCAPLFSGVSLWAHSLASLIELTTRWYFPLRGWPAGYLGTKKVSSNLRALALVLHREELEQILRRHDTEEAVFVDHHQV